MNDTVGSPARQFRHEGAGVRTAVPTEAGIAYAVAPAVPAPRDLGVADEEDGPGHAALAASRRSNCPA